MMHERSYTPPFNLNGFESNATKKLLHRRICWPRNGKKIASERHLSKKERSRKEKCGSRLLERNLYPLFNIIGQDGNYIMQTSFRVAEL
jgi:hypothetical protein